MLELIKTMHTHICRFLFMLLDIEELLHAQQQQIEIEDPLHSEDA